MGFFSLFTTTNIVASDRRRSFFFYTTPNSNGYTLIELVTTVVILGILAGISVPRIGNIIAQSKIDEAKALLNTAAADCLQKSRLNDSNKDLIDEAIISDKRLNGIGFKIDKSNNADKCSYFQLSPINQNDNIRFPIGFSVADGSLSKFANPTSTDKGSISSCESWAGVNCRQDESLKKLVDWKKSIAAAKRTCEDNYNKWLSGGTTSKKFQRWNPNAEAGCPTKPPKDGSESYKTNTCTTNGCNRTVYGLDGEFVGFTETDYERALEDKYGQACTEWIASKKLNRYTNSPQDRPQELNPECGSQKFWFYQGNDVGTKEEFDKRICSDNLEKEKQTAGKRTVQGCGNTTYYFCENTIKESERAYKECSCDAEKYDKAQAGKEGKFMTTEAGAKGCGDYWICDKQILDNKEDYEEKCKKENNEPLDSNEEPETLDIKPCYSPYPICKKNTPFTPPACLSYKECMKGK